MRLILGLGNPGAKYAHSRHNVGFDAVEACAAFFQVRLRKRCFRLYRQASVAHSVLLLEPLTSMNRSGEVMRYFPDVHAEDVVVVCDQMDLPPGFIRIRRGGSSAGHNGLKSLIGALGSSAFTRIYIGIGRPSNGVSVVEHVLSVDSCPELQEGIMLASAALRDLIEGKSMEEVMLAYNRRNHS
ncbi:MAG: aminoacyl-tRNA hydrolase [Sphaerochaetaceae bacterium]